MATTTLAAMLGTATGAGSDGKLYLDEAPDGMAKPYGVMRLIDKRPQGDDGRYLSRGFVEVIFYDHDRSGHSTTPKQFVNACADRVEEAWLRWEASGTDQTLRAGPIESRFTIPYTDPVDRSLKAVRLLLGFHVVPGHLAQYAP
jgi:hypothetical protein